MKLPKCFSEVLSIFHPIFHISYREDGNSSITLLEPALHTGGVGWNYCHSGAGLSDWQEFDAYLQRITTCPGLPRMSSWCECGSFSDKPAILGNWGVGHPKSQVPLSCGWLTLKLKTTLRILQQGWPSVPLRGTTHPLDYRPLMGYLSFCLTASIPLPLLPRAISVRSTPGSREQVWGKVRLQVESSYPSWLCVPRVCTHTHSHSAWTPTYPCHYWLTGGGWHSPGSAAPQWAPQALTMPSLCKVPAASLLVLVTTTKSRGAGRDFWSDCGEGFWGVKTWALWHSRWSFQTGCPISPLWAYPQLHPGFSSEIKNPEPQCEVHCPAAEPAAGHMGTREWSRERGWGHWGLCALVSSTPQEALDRGPGAEDGGRDGRCVLWEEFPTGCDNCDARSAVGGKDLFSRPSKALPLAFISRPQRMQGLCSFSGSCRETGSRVECPKVPVLAPQPWSHLFSSWSEVLWHLLLLTC